MLRTVTTGFVCLLCISTAAVRGAEQVEYRAGVAAVDITPDYPIRLNGFGFRREESEGVSQRIFARALAIQAGSQPPLVLLTVDSLGIRLPMVDDLAGRLEKSHGIPRPNVALTFTHSHCTPKVNGACDNIFSQPIPAAHQAHIDRYTRELAEHLHGAALKALESLAPATLEWGVGAVGFAMNRRTKGGPVDHDLPVLVVRDPDSRQIRAVYVTYACHCVTLSFNQVSGDWAGYAAEMIERRFPGTTALVSIGCGSDQNPNSGVTGDKVDVAASQGVEIATAVEKVLGQNLRRVTGTPRAQLQRIDLPLNPQPTPAELQQRSRTDGVVGYNARTQLERLDRGEPLLESIEYPVQSWSFGDSLCVVFLAGEVCVDYSLRLKHELDASRLWLNAYSNDFCSYIPSERLVKEGGYGGGSETPYFALPTTLKAGLEQKIVDEVHRQAGQNFIAAAGTRGIAPLTPQQSMGTMQTDATLEVRLVASEPEVNDPVAIDFGPDGRLWVAEMNDYGRGVYEDFSQTGRVRWLTDRDGDGRYETAHTFVDQLRFPTDVKVWGDGVLICDAPDILLARDTNGDGSADEIKKLFSGFEERNAQARVNSLRLGLDNRLYGSGGLFGGVISGPSLPSSVDVSGRDFRIDPITWHLEPVAGRTQQGRCRDDWDNWFGCSNGTLAQQYPVDDTYYRNSPHITPPPTAVFVPTGQGANQLIPAGELVQFQLSGPTGRPTSACGLGIYRDTRLGNEFAGDAFVCEPVHQLVHRMSLEPAGVSVVGTRAESESDREFLSSTDRWFRPVQVRTGPDGALWVVDMYRFVIEHSRWIPAETLQELDVFAGRSRGRIYRVVRRDDVQTGWPNLTAMSPTELAGQLNHRNGVLRDLAQQLLVSGKSTEADGAVRSQLQEDLTAPGLVQTLCTLQGLGTLTADDLLPALRHPHPQVRRHAVRLAEPFLDSSPGLATAVYAQRDHDSPVVRIQLAHSLSASHSRQAAETLVQMLRQDGADPYIGPALLASLDQPKAGSVWSQWLAVAPTDLESPVAQRLLPAVATVGDQSTVEKLLQAIVESGRDLSDTELLRSSRVVRLESVLDSLDRRHPEWGDSVADEITGLLARTLASAHKAAVDPQLPEPLRRSAIRVLGRPGGAFTSAVLKASNAQRPDAAQRQQVLLGLLSSRETLAIQQAALQAVVAGRSPATGTGLTDRWNQLGPQLRPPVLDALLSRLEWTQALIEALESGSIPPAELDAARRQSLLTHADETIKKRAAEVLNATAPSPRSEIVARYLAQLQPAADAVAGRTLFGKHCGTCHRLSGEGEQVGPDLAALTDRSAPALLNAILDPNREVDARYLTWTAVLDSGLTASGLLAEETATSVTLLEAKAKQRTILRQELESLQSTRRSLMPEGLEKDLSPEQLSQLIAYVSSQGRQPAVTQTDNTAPAASVQVPRDTAAIVTLLLDDSQTVELRQRAIDLNPGKAPYIITGLAAGTKGNRELEAKRIPWIWRVSIACGKRNDGGELRDTLDVCLPALGEPLEHWQAVALGGGIVNGISQQGVWPGRRLDGILKQVPDFRRRWEAALVESRRMMPDQSIKPGTRYDLLRMIALDDPQVARPLLISYLNNKDQQLQAGAIAGLSDIPDEAIPDGSVAADLLKYLADYTPPNRAAAIDALRRTDSRRQTVQQGLQSGRIALTDEERAKLREP